MPCDVDTAIKWLKQKRTAKDLANLKRFGIVAHDPLGVSVANIRIVAKRIGRDHALAAALWKTGCYEARMLATLIEDPASVTAVQMDKWCRDFDNWAICDTVCFCLFDRSPRAWGKVEQWGRLSGEFQKRAAFALLASLAGHDKAAVDQAFRQYFPLIERAATDERNFVKKGVSWALRRIGTRNDALRKEAVVVAQRLAESEDKTARWVGKDAWRDLNRRKTKP